MKYTATEVLMIFKELHRLGSPLDCEANPSIEIKNDMTIEEWRSSSDLMHWRQLAKSLNQEFEMNLGRYQWKQVLEPARKKKLLGVCQLIAVNSSKRPIKPIKLFGVQCKSAGIFRYIVDESRRRGVDVKSLRPSSKISDYLSSNYEEILPIIARLNSGVIEKLRVVRSKKKRSFWQKLKIFDETGYEVEAVGILTFRDYVMKMV